LNTRTDGFAKMSCAVDEKKKSMPPESEPPMSFRASKKKVLFLCTGNYYRSRYAEELFNHHANALHLSWIATSRALALERGKDNVGSIANSAILALQADQISPADPARGPLACTMGDLIAADLIVAVKEAEHRELLAARFSGWEHKAIFWHVHDLDQAQPREALAQLKTHVTSLIEKLAAQQ
jgi:protein-tyrosine phosphatase